MALQKPSYLCACKSIHTKGIARATIPNTSSCRLELKRQTRRAIPTNWFSLLGSAWFLLPLLLLRNSPHSPSSPFSHPSPAALALRNTLQDTNDTNDTNLPVCSSSSAAAPNESRRNRHQNPESGPSPTATAASDVEKRLLSGTPLTVKRPASAPPRGSSRSPPPSPRRCPRSHPGRRVNGRIRR